MRTLATLALLLTAAAASGQTLLVTHVRGDVRLGDRPVRVQDRLEPDDQLQFADARALVAVASPRGQAVLQARTPAQRRRMQAGLLFVRDLVAPLRDRAHASTRSLGGPSASFGTLEDTRQTMADGPWLVLGPQAISLPFLRPNDVAVLRHTSPDGVSERPLPLALGQLQIDRDVLGPACTDPAEGEPPLAWVVVVPAEGPEQQLTGYLQFACPDPAGIRASLEALWSATGAPPGRRLPEAVEFLTGTYGPTYQPALEAWLAAE